MTHRPKKLFRKRFWLWVLATIITLATVVYQRRTGPTNPYRGIYTIDDVFWRYTLKRSPECGTPLEVRIPGSDAHQAELIWREYPTERPWKSISMAYSDTFYKAAIPSQPPAGKVEYAIRIKTEKGSTIQIPDQNSRVIARYKNPVPLWALIPHILFMFTGMLLSNRLGLCAVSKEPIRYSLVVTTFLILCLGIGIFGPIVQKFAFGQYWTGWPVGTDLTDNKSLLALLVWLFPIWRVLRKKDLRIALLAASIATLIIFMIPHSLLGSEHDYSNNEISNNGFSIDG